MRDLACVLLLLTAAAAGCCCPPIQAAREAARQAQSANNMHQLGIAIHRFQSREGAWPASLEDLKPFTEMYDELITNPVTGDYPGYEYVKPELIRNVVPFDTVVLYQLRTGSRDLQLPVLYADGAVRPVGREAP